MRWLSLVLSLFVLAGDLVAQTPAKAKPCLFDFGWRMRMERRLDQLIDQRQQPQALPQQAAPAPQSQAPDLATLEMLRIIATNQERLMELVARQQTPPAPAPQPIAVPPFVPAPAPPPPATTPAPQVLVYLLPPQSFPIAGQPQQPLPIAGAPLQPLPKEGRPLQPFPIDGKPLQPLPKDGAPQQPLPIERPPMLEEAAPPMAYHRFTVRTRAVWRTK